MMMTWGAIEPAESPQSRLRLDFGLRPAILALNEWAVPGLGGVFFVRQLTWSCLGIMLADEINRPMMAARTAESIEALASWIAIGRGGYEKDDRVQGKRKLRNLDGISFDAVSTGGAYVTVPFRRSATAALPGLGFCVSAEFRFNSLQLAPAGVALASTVLRDGSVADRLRNWISKPQARIKSTSEQLKQALLPGAETSDECQLVLDRLLADPDRARLARLLQRCDTTLSSLQTDEGIAQFLGQIDSLLQRTRLDVCFAFERVRASAVKAAQALADAIEAGAQPWSALVAAVDVQRDFEVFQRDCNLLRSRLDKVSDIPTGIREFCDEQRSALGLEQRIRALADRLPQIFTLQPRTLDRGMGYTTDLVAADSIDPSEGETVMTTFLLPRPLVRLKRLYEEARRGAANAV
jgi:hypothetical protein